MRATGIGASVRRKEDHRFITGKGHYTDDISRPAKPRLFRPLAARPRDDQIDRCQGRGRHAGRGRRAHRRRACRRQDGNLICGWMIHSKDGSPMKMAPHPALANGKACHVGDPVAVVVAETLAQARDAAEKVKVDYAVLPAVADPAARRNQARRKSTKSRRTIRSINGISAIRRRSMPP